MNGDLGESHAESGLFGGRYQVLDRIGSGAMGVVYEARHVGTLGHCAIKVLRSEVGCSPERVQQFLREARASGQLKSDHIVKVFDSGIDSATGRPYLVMEYLEGEDLEVTLKRLGALDVEAALKIAYQATLGLCRAHEANVVHRDIKPANLFLTRGDSGLVVVKILDFGVAKMKMEGADQTVLSTMRSGTLVGTPLYMAPEQFQGESTIEACSDVWSLGVLMWELLTGKSPFYGTSLARLVARVTREKLPSLRDEAPWVPGPVAEIVQRALSRSIEGRFKDALELKKALDRVVDGPHLRPELLRSHSKPHALVEQTTVSLPAMFFEAVPRRAPRVAFIAGGVGLALGCLAALGGALFAVTSNAGAPEPKLAEPKPALRPLLAADLPRPIPEALNAPLAGGPRPEPRTTAQPEARPPVPENQPSKASVRSRSRSAPLEPKAAKPESPRSELPEGASFEPSLEPSSEATIPPAVGFGPVPLETSSKSGKAAAAPRAIDSSGLVLNRREFEPTNH
jgi:serine/threonine-protein kinase